MQLLLQVRVTSRSRLLAPVKLWVYYVRGCHRGLAKWNDRPLSITACLTQVHEPPLQQPGGSAQELTGAFESSAQARWAADAAHMSELPAQGDLSSIGLGGSSPAGFLQNMLEMVHLHTGLPWWGSVALCTVFMRFMLFPLIVNLQKNAVRMNNIRPHIEKVQERIRLHKEAGEDTLVAMETTNLMKLYQQNDCSPLKMMIAPLVQVPLFVSFFIAIRGMAYAPVESMKSGGMLWFTDLTVPDPFYILPVLNSALFMVSIELGGDVGVTNPQMEKMKFVMRALAIIMIPITGSFPSGLFMYWTTTSMFSLGQVIILKVPRIRIWLSMPVAVKHPATPADKSPGFMAQLKKNYATTVVMSEVKQRKQAAVKKRKRLLNDKSIKLYDKPPLK